MRILKFRNNLSAKSYLTVSVLGNSLKLNIKYSNTSTVELNKKASEIELYLPKEYKSKEI